MLAFFAGYLQQTVYRRKTRFVNNIISTGSLFSGPDKSDLKKSERGFPVTGKIQRESKCKHQSRS